MTSDTVLVVASGQEAGIDDATAVLRALAHEPRAVVYDLTSDGDARLDVPGVLAAVDPYLTVCSGTPLLLCADRGLVSALRSNPMSARVSVWASPDAALAAARRLPPIDRYTVDLDPVPTAPCEARGLVGQALARWDAPHLIESARSVITELATNALTHAATPFTASISRSNNHPGRARLAVRDGVSARPVLLPPTHSLTSGGLGLWLVDQFARGWGTVTLDPGKVVWAVLDGTIAP